MKIVLSLILFLFSVSISSSGKVDSLAKTFGGTYDDYGYSIQLTQDGGYTVTGRTSSFGAGNIDFLVIKLTSGGDTAWAKTFGGTNNDLAFSIHQTHDSGYIVVGYIDSFGAGGYDFLAIKIDSTSPMHSSCPWEDAPVIVNSQSLSVTSPSLTVTSPSVGAPCTPTVTSLTITVNEVCGLAGVEEIEVVHELRLLECQPNIFTYQTHIYYSLPGQGKPEIKIIDLTGRVIRTFNLTEREGKIIWDGKNELGAPVPQDVYFCVLCEAYYGEGKPRIAKKLLLITPK